MRNSLAATAVSGLLLSVIGFSFLIQHDPGFLRAEDTGDPLFRVLGTAREALGDIVFMRADSYLHGGLRADLLENVRKNGEFGTDADKNKRFSHLLTGDLIGKVYSQVNVVTHRHIEGEESKELLPLLDISTRLNPHNVPAVLTAAYWFDNRFSDTDKALSILEKGRQDNPESWEINYEIGRIYFENKKDYPTAVRYLRTAIEELGKASAEEMTPFDLIRSRYQLAESYNFMGEQKQALVFYREALSFYRGKKESGLKQVLEKKISTILGK